MFNIPGPRHYWLKPTAVLALLSLSVSLHAQQPIPVSLKGTAEVPPINTSASGTGVLTVMLDRSVSGSIKIAGFVPTGAHIHEAAIGKNGPAIISLVQSGSDTFLIPEATRLTVSQYKSYQAGSLYVNVHSTAYPNGEVRAQLRQLEKMAMPLRPGY